MKQALSGGASWNLFRTNYEIRQLTGSIRRLTIMSFRGFTGTRSCNQ